MEVVTAETVEMAAMAVMAVGRQLEAQDTADTNLALELLAVQRHLKELGRGRHKSGLLMVSHFVEEPWYILGGWSLQLIVSLKTHHQPSV